MGKFDFPSPHLDSIGDPALDLIDRILSVDGADRPTANDCLRHPWLTIEGPEPSERGEYTYAAPKSVCNHTFRSGEIVYGCADCAVKAEIRLCRTCFKASDHVDHMVSMSVAPPLNQSSAQPGNMNQVISIVCQRCSCGDSSVWKTRLSCALHE